MFEKKKNDHLFNEMCTLMETVDTTIKSTYLSVDCPSLKTDYAQKTSNTSNRWKVINTICMHFTIATQMKS